jgi:hypothetical protein
LKEQLTDDDIIDDAYIKAFVMCLGVSPPMCIEVKKRFASYVKTTSKTDGCRITEDFVFRCIPRYISFLHGKG